MMIPAPPPPPPRINHTTDGKRIKERIERKYKSTIDNLKEGSMVLKVPDVALPVGENPAWNDPKLYVLGIQHTLVIVWNAIMIPSTLSAMMGGANLEKAEAIQTSLFVTGISTILQVGFGSRLPVVMRRSQAFIIPAISIALSTNSNCSITLNHRQRFKLSVRRVQGASIIASLVQMIVAFSGLTKFFTRELFVHPLRSAPFLTLIGLGLYSRGYPQLLRCKEIGVPTLLIIVLSTQLLPRIWKSKRELVDRFAVTSSVIVAWLFAEILTAAGAYNSAAQGTQANCRTDRSGHIPYTPWIKISLPFQWGSPIFETLDAFPMIAACFVASIESSGTFISTSRLGGAYRIRSKALDRAIGVQGIGTLIEAIFGMGHGSTASVEHAGLVGLTQVGSRRVVLFNDIIQVIFSSPPTVATIAAFFSDLLHNEKFLKRILSKESREQEDASSEDDDDIPMAADEPKKEDSNQQAAEKLKEEKKIIKKAKLKRSKAADDGTLMFKTLKQLEKLRFADDIHTSVKKKEAKKDEEKKQEKVPGRPPAPYLIRAKKKKLKDIKAPDTQIYSLPSSLSDFFS
ncbi:purine permease, putative [Ricinus communis]|uniref:Purine permease, putative n=1 Tax=Ricinus communis TaxID=3988 RepID=B9T8H8_RICCO|nr:purine permease, putative [Ricinus communis]